MEEKKQLTYEQLQQVALTLQQRCMQAEERLAAINMTTTRLNYLFKVLEFETSFSTDFVHKCVTEIESLLEIKEEGSEEKSE